MKAEIEKAWTDLYQSTAEPRLSLLGEISLAVGAGLIAGVVFGLIFVLN